MCPSLSDDPSLLIYLSLCPALTISHLPFDRITLPRMILILPRLRQIIEFYAFELRALAEFPCSKTPDEVGGEDAELEDEDDEVEDCAEDVEGVLGDCWEVGCQCG